jgi:hypothetical protein
MGKKTAFIAEFSVKTRIIVESDNLESEEVYNKAVQMARDNIMQAPEDYLCGENSVFDRNG